jgi:polyhydroxybutyrate depolymerase
MVLDPAPAATKDLQFVVDMLDELESELCIDPLRIYSTGYSAGGMMSVRLACSLSDRIASIAPVDGVYYPPIRSALAGLETCPDTRPVPVTAIVGKDDLYWPLLGGTSAPGLTGLFDIEAQTMPNWATHNGCSTTPVMSMAFLGVRLAENPGCAAGATTRLYVVEDADGDGPGTAGMGHQWPDSATDLFFPPPAVPLGLNTHLMSATDVIWDFFEAHPMPQAEPPPSPSPSPEPTPTPVPPPGPFPVGGNAGLVDGPPDDSAMSPGPFLWAALSLIAAASVFAAWRGTREK